VLDTELATLDGDGLEARLIAKIYSLEAANNELVIKYSLAPVAQLPPEKQLRNDFFRLQRNSLVWKASICC